jgi:PHD/YefM family antitoxin component YafN of YafNO toxin-antitoxin module
MLRPEEPRMREITASDFQRHPRRIQDLALREPVAVTDHGRPKVVSPSKNTSA